MQDQRQNPANFLQRAEEEARKESYGKLKIYLGAAPGVGKTHTMLTDAIEMRAQGLDVVVGIVESHGREEIESLLKKLEITPRFPVEYHGVTMHEFDLEGALKRHPALILMDEMAHTNAPELRHKKRWQDIKELLDRGIDVYTTLNVQHIESLSSDVAQIVHAPVHETVPDLMIEMADTIELVDLPPDELLKRLREGKVYIPEQAALAEESFFRKGNLIALRELALRVTADRVEAEVLLYRQGQGIRHIWPIKEKILVFVGAGEESKKLIRRAKKVATILQAEWIGVYVDRPHLKNAKNRRLKAIQNLRFAEALGAQTRVLTGFDIVKEVLSFAHEQNVTQIMIWKHIRTRWHNLFFRNLADEIVRYSGEIDVYVMTGSVEKKPEKSVSESKTEFPWKNYVVAVGVVVVATAVDFLVHPYLGASNLIMVYLLAVTLMSRTGHRGPAMLTGVLSVLAYDFFFIPPYYSFAVADVQYSFTLIVMLVVSQVIIQLTLISREQADSARKTANQVSALYMLSRQLSRTRGVDNLLNVAIDYIASAFQSDVIALLPTHQGLKIRGKNPKHFVLDQKERGIAEWVYELGQMAGLGTDTLSFSNALYLPLVGSQKVIGVLRVEPMDADRLLDPEQRNRLEGCVNQLALALEVDRVSSLEADKIALKKEVASVKQLIHSAVKASGEKLEKRPVQVNVPDDVPLVPYDPVLLEEVMFHLIENAIHFAQDQSPIAFRASFGDGLVFVRIEDQGPSVLLGKLSKHRWGEEMGMNLCYTIIHAHGGEIWVERSEFGGPTFVFTLPLGE